MKASHAPALASLLASLTVTACEGAPPDDAATAAPTDYMAVGTLNSINTIAGTVNVSHAAVPAAGWPAMTMDFKLAKPAEATELKPGDRVDIHFTIQSGMNATITRIAAIK